LYIALAFLLDQLIGDPRSSLHPVVLTGHLINWLDKRLNDPGKPPAVLLLRGGLLVLLVLLVVYATAMLLLQFFSLLPSLPATLLTVVLLKSALAARALADAAEAVLRPLEEDNLACARLALSRIVGRDTEELGRTDVARATVETVAENTVDGVTAPLFYALLGGLPLALLYRAVNTMDSMLGYKNNRYQYFGTAAARLDDLANWLPARLSVPVMLLSAVLLRFDARSAWKAVRLDGRKHQSPNSGLPEALVAGALGITLGGESRYGGRVVHRPLLWSAGRVAQPADIGSAVRLMRLTSLLFLLAGLLVQALLHGGGNYNGL
jgi:adenosylcobinamide-phosphate synthase